MKRIELTQGKFALISDEDFEKVSKHKWCAFQNNLGNRVWYAVRKETNKRKLVYMHRFIMDAPKGKDVDHRDHNGLNNTRENLKVCPRSENGLNRYQANKDNKTSKIRGVCWDKAKKKWQALICINKKRYWLGYHTDIKDAEKAVQNKLQAMR